MLEEVVDTVLDYPVESEVVETEVVETETSTIETLDISVSDAEIITSELVMIRYALYFLIIVVLASRFVRGRN